MLLAALPASSAMKTLALELDDRYRGFG